MGFSVYSRVRGVCLCLSRHRSRRRAHVCCEVYLCSNNVFVSQVTGAKSHGIGDLHPPKLELRPGHLVSRRWHLVRHQWPCIIPQPLLRIHGGRKCSWSNEETRRTPPWGAGTVGKEERERMNEFTLRISWISFSTKKCRPSSCLNTTLLHLLRIYILNVIFRQSIYKSSRF